MLSVENGRIVGGDLPDALLALPDSRFAAMVRADSALAIPILTEEVV